MKQLTKITLSLVFLLMLFACQKDSKDLISTTDEALNEGTPPLGAATSTNALNPPLIGYPVNPATLVGSYVGTFRSSGGANFTAYAYATLLSPGVYRFEAYSDTMQTTLYGTYDFNTNISGYAGCANDANFGPPYYNSHPDPTCPASGIIVMSLGFYSCTDIYISYNRVCGQLMGSGHSFTGSLMP